MPSIRTVKYELRRVKGKLGFKLAQQDYRKMSLR